MGIYRKAIKYTGHNFKIGKWYNIAGSYDDATSTMKLYVGGK
jgi:hypothetical protein